MSRLDELRADNERLREALRRAERGFLKHKMFWRAEAQRTHLLEYKVRASNADELARAMAFARARDGSPKGRDRETGLGSRRPGPAGMRPHSVGIKGPPLMTQEIEKVAGFFFRSRMSLPQEEANKAWQVSLAHHREMLAKYPEYRHARSRVHDCFRDAEIAITALSSSPSREKELSWRSHVDALSALHPGSECEGATCPICKALVAVTYAFHERDRATLTEKASTSEGERG